MNPSIHDVSIAAAGRGEPSGRDGNSFAFRDRAGCSASERVVEPDGIEPTTSCLQSTRSTN